MAFKMTFIISVLATLIYLFTKTRDKLTFAGFCVALLTLVTGNIVTGTILDKNFPNSFNLIKWTLVVVDFLCIGTFLSYVFYKSEKYKGSERGKVVPDFRVLFKASPGNIIFWAVILLFNFIALLLDIKK